MATIFQDKDRGLIPRWRSVDTTLRLGELRPLQSGMFDAIGAKQLLDDKRAEVGDAESTPHLGDLLSVALTLGLRHEAISVAMELTGRSDVPSALRGTVARLTSSRVEEQQTGVDEQRIRDDVRVHRAILNLDPRNALAYVDLALAFESLGQSHKAVDAIHRALALAPDNRHVLRSAARLFIHQNDFDAAQAILRKSDATRADPWLLAAEISVTRVIGGAQINAKKSMRLVDGWAHDPFHVSELSSAIGSLELEHGDIKRGLRLLRKSLTSPTENAIAQASWVDRTFKCSLLHETPATADLSAEATAFEAYWKGDLEAATQSSLRWLGDQVFSSRPAIMASHLLMVVQEDFRSASRILKFSLRANPTDFNIRNNLAFAYANLGMHDDAMRLIESINTGAITPSDGAVLNATRGFLEFRRGRRSTGRQHYQDAIRVFTSRGDSYRRTVAGLYWLSEELTFRDRNALTPDICAQEVIAADPALRLLEKRVDVLKSQPGTRSES